MCVVGFQQVWCGRAKKYGRQADLPQHLGKALLPHQGAHLASLRKRNRRSVSKNFRGKLEGSQEHRLTIAERPWHLALTGVA